MSQVENMDDSAHYSVVVQGSIELFDSLDSMVSAVSVRHSLKHQLGPVVFNIIDGFFDLILFRSRA